MADVKISGLPAATSLSGAELIPVVQRGATKHAAVELLRSEVVGASRFNSAVRNVKLDFGAIGDGKADDTAAIQKAFHGLSESNVHTVYLPRGTYRVTAPIKVPFAPGLHIVGDGGEQMTRIVQDTSGQPVLWFTRSLTHDVYVADLTLAYPGAQKANGANAVYLADPTNRNATWFKHVYERVTVFNAFRGWKIESTKGAPTCWNFRWRDCRLKGIGGSVIMMRGNQPNGQPVSAIENMLVENTNTSVTSVEPAFDLGANEMLVDQLDIEGWAHSIFIMIAGGFITARGLHVEQHRFQRPDSWIFDMTNAGLSIDGFSISGSATAANTGNLGLFKLNEAAPARIENGVIDVRTSSSKAIVQEALWRGGHDSDYPPVQWYNVVAARTNGVNLPGTGPRASSTLRSVATHGLMPDGSRGTQLPAGAPLYMYSPDGTRYRVTVENGGTLSVTQV